MSLHLSGLVNTRPQKNQHLVANVAFSHGANSDLAPVECRCGWTGIVSDFSAHRRAEGQRWSGGQLGVPDMLRDNPNVWQHSCRVPKCDKPGTKAKGYCGGHYERVLRGKSLDTPLGLPRGKAA